MVYNDWISFPVLNGNAANKSSFLVNKVLLLALWLYFHRKSWDTCKLAGMCYSTHWLVGQATAIISQSVQLFAGKVLQFYIKGTKCENVFFSASQACYIFSAFFVKITKPNSLLAWLPLSAFILPQCNKFYIHAVFVSSLVILVFRRETFTQPVLNTANKIPSKSPVVYIRSYLVICSPESQRHQITPALFDFPHTSSEL